MIMIHIYIALSFEVTQSAMCNEEHFLKIFYKAITSEIILPKCFIINTLYDYENTFVRLSFSQ